MISIVLPVYNGEKYIEQSINSILNQTEKRWELIIVNDCSNDRTKAIIESYAIRDRRIRIINNSINQKLPLSLNIGFQEAKGDFFTWTSDDNLYKENALEIMLNKLEGNADAGLVYCDYTSIDENGMELAEIIMKEPDKLIYTNTVGACFLYRKGVFDKLGGYDPAMFLVEDYEYWLRIYQQFEILHLQKNLYYYRLHGASLSSTRLETVVKQTAKLKLKYLPFILKKTDNKKDRYELFDSIIEADLENKKELEKVIVTMERAYWLHMYMRKNKLLLLKLVSKWKS